MILFINLQFYYINCFCFYITDAVPDQRMYISGSVQPPRHPLRIWSCSGYAQSQNVKVPSCTSPPFYCVYPWGSPPQHLVIHFFFSRIICPGNQRTTFSQLLILVTYFLFFIHLFFISNILSTIIIYQINATCKRLN